MKGKPEIKIDNQMSENEFRRVTLVDDRTMANIGVLGVSKGQLKKRLENHYC